MFNLYQSTLKPLSCLHEYQKNMEVVKNIKRKVPRPTHSSLIRVWLPNVLQMHMKKETEIRQTKKNHTSCKESAFFLPSLLLAVIPFLPSILKTKYTVYHWLSVWCYTKREPVSLITPVVSYQRPSPGRKASRMSFRSLWAQKKPFLPSVYPSEAVALVWIWGQASPGSKRPSCFKATACSVKKKFY